MFQSTWNLVTQNNKFSLDQVSPDKLPKGYEFAIINVDGHYNMAFLGKRVKSSSSQGEIVDEYWYSPTGEMIQLRNERLHLVFGLPTEWRNNQSAAPQWPDVLSKTSESRWVRTRDEMPNYRYGVQDSIVTRALTAPPNLDSKAKEIAPTSSESVRWVQDQIETTAANGNRWAFQQLFALEQNRVVYSEQCVSSTFCLRIRKLKP
jgi:hypothetical protein